jgi:hypothetical protein
LLCFAAAAAQAAPPGSAPLELRGRWLIGQGPLHRDGRFCLRALDAERASLRVTLPRLPLLAEQQYFLREGEALLSWTQPAGARELLGDGGPWRALLAELPPAAWAALLGADGQVLASLILGSAAAPGGAWREVRGRLGGHPACLRLRGDRAWSLDWELPAGSLHCQWPAVVEGGPQWLRLRLPTGAWLRIAVRGGPRPDLTLEEWLFVEASGNRSGQDGL